MKLPDINVLVGAFRRDAADHAWLSEWLARTIDSGELIGLTPAVTSGFVRVITNSRVFADPSTIDEALGHIEQLRTEGGARDIRPGSRHWEIFAELCRQAHARGNLVSDAAHAAVAIEHGATWVSLDSDFARFPGLRWEKPQRSF